MITMKQVYRKQIAVALVSQFSHPVKVYAYNKRHCVSNMAAVVNDNTPISLSLIALPEHLFSPIFNTEI